VGAEISRDDEGEASGLAEFRGGGSDEEDFESGYGPG
jgi:hypothetical protein